MTKFAAYQSEAEIEEVVRNFENCVYAPEEFAHAKHLTVAAWYFLCMEEEAAKAKMRSGLKKFIHRHGKSAYHVTITEFWLQMVERQVGSSDENRLERVNRTVKNLENKKLIHEHYSNFLIRSAQAKECWVEPDLQPMMVS